MNKRARAFREWLGCLWGGLLALLALGVLAWLLWLVWKLQPAG